MSSFAGDPVVFNSWLKTSFSTLNLNSGMFWRNAYTTVDNSQSCYHYEPYSTTSLLSTIAIQPDAMVKTWFY